MRLKILRNLAVVTPAAAVVFLLSFLDGAVDTEAKWVYLCVIAAIWLCFVIKTFRQKGENHPDIFIGAYALFLIWELFFRILGRGNPVLYPPLENVFQVFFNDHALILRGIGRSLLILFAGFTIAVISGNVLGMLVGYTKRLNSDLAPIAKILSPIPPMVYTPYLIAVMPTFTAASIAVIGFGMFWPTFLSMIQRVQSLNQRTVDSAKAMDVSTFTMLFRVILPDSIPAIVGNLKVQLSTVFMILIMAEMIGATSGLGFFIKKYSDYADYTRVLAGIIMVGIVITVLNMILEFAEKKLIRWKHI